jgi:hypothetical protein
MFLLLPRFFIVFSGIEIIYRFTMLWLKLYLLHVIITI